jgi:hypothetical protein
MIRLVAPASSIGSRGDLADRPILKHPNTPFVVDASPEKALATSQD